MNRTVGQTNGIANCLQIYEGRLHSPGVGVESALYGLETERGRPHVRLGHGVRRDAPRGDQQSAVLDEPREEPHGVLLSVRNTQCAD